MRRTRHVVLPVRSWQYIGLLIVSLACLTLGLVSRDREGHAGSLAGPELTHQAPHEVDACPNLNLFVKSPTVELEGITKLNNDHEMKESSTSPTSRKSVLSRSLSLDRLSRSGSREIRERLSGSRDLRSVERLSRSRTRVSDDGSINRFRESRFRTITQSRDIKNSLDPATRVSRSRDLFNGATDRRSAKQNFERRLADPVNSRLKDRRSRSTERRELEIAQNRIDRSADRRESLTLQRLTNDHRDRKSLSMERRVDRQESREASRREYRDLSRNRVPNHRFEIRERGSRSVERRMSIEHRDAERSGRREDRRNLLNRSRFARGDIDRNNNLDRRNRERSLENRRTLHDRVANQERGSRFSVAREARGDLIRFDDRRTLSRSMKHPGINHLNREILNRRVRSIEFNTERSEERRSLERSMERREMDHHSGRRKAENRFADRKSLDQAMSRVSSKDLRQERINDSQRSINRRDSRENAAIRKNYRMVRSRYDVEEIANRERRERFARSRSADRNSVDHREIARIRNSRDHDHRSREERRIVLQKSREAERRTSEQRVPERRALERRAALNSARLDARKSSERRIDNTNSREGSRLVDRRLERNSESRNSRGRILERRSTLDSQKSSERRIVDNVKSHEGSRLTDRRLERNSESRDSRGRILERRSTLDSRRSSERRIVDNVKPHEGSRLADRRLERNSESRDSRGRILERRSTLDSRRSSERRIIDNVKLHEGSRLADRHSERSSESRVSRGRILEKRSTLDSRRSSERRINDDMRERSRMQDRRVERNSELRNAISMLPTERRANSRTASLGNQVLRSSETQRGIRHLRERRVARSVENRPTEFRERESIRHLRQRSTRNIEDSSRLSFLRRVAHVPEQNREQRRLSAERMLARSVDNEQLSAKWERNLRDARVEKNVETKAKIVPNSMKNYEFFKYPMAYDFMRQAFVVALCTVYGLSLYNGKKSSLGNSIMQHAQRFIIW